MLEKPFTVMVTHVKDGKTPEFQIIMDDSIAKTFSPTNPENIRCALANIDDDTAKRISELIQSIKYGSERMMGEIVGSFIKKYLNDREEAAKVGFSRLGDMLSELKTK